MNDPAVQANEEDATQDYTVYKAKAVFDNLICATELTAMTTSRSNFFMGGIIGALNLVLTIVFWFTKKNFLIEMSVLFTD